MTNGKNKMKETKTETETRTETEIEIEKIKSMEKWKIKLKRADGACIRSGRQAGRLNSKCNCDDGKTSGTAGLKK